MEKVSPDEKAILIHNKARFASLPNPEKTAIAQGIQKIEEKMGQPFFSRLHLTIPSSIELIWSISAIVISILALKNYKYTKPLALLLPLLALFYSYQSLQSRPPSLYPSETEIVNNYLKKPLDKDPFIQREQLLKGFKTYLIERWAKQTPSADPAEFTRQVEEGEFYFNKELAADRIKNNFNYERAQEHPFLLLLYIAWNIYFWWVI
jgi:hypothetical protein